jgi:signal transduction histidine kinase
MKKMKLQTRLTVFIAIVLLCMCAVLSAVSIFSAQRIYSSTSARPSSNGGVTEEVYYSSNSKFATVSLISISLAFVTGTGATYLIARNALNPITELAGAVGRIDEHNLSLTVQAPRSCDEVAALSAAFNSMIGKLERAFASQKDFAASAAYELKTPLTAMISKVEVCQLNDDPSPSECKETLADVLQSAERLSALVDDLLEMHVNSDAESYVTFDVGKLFDEIIEDASQDNPKDVTFQNEAGGVRLTGDRELLYRAFLNLVWNAVKYNKPRGSVVISAKEVPGGVEIAIADTGIGISENDLDRIFEPFYRVDKSRSREFGGSGLGLALARTVIEKHEGEIRAESTPGVSTVMTVCLPQRNRE